MWQTIGQTELNWLTEQIAAGFPPCLNNPTVNCGKTNQPYQLLGGTDEPGGGKRINDLKDLYFKGGNIMLLIEVLC